MEHIAALVDEMFARGIGSAAALSIGDAGREVERMFRGTTRRVPTTGIPVDEHTLFDVASLTKPIVTAACAMVLVDQGALDLAAPIRAYLPDAQSTGTVAQLLGHAAGCAAHVEFFKELRAHPPADPRAALVTMAQAIPTRPPGTTAVYSDLGYIQLGAVIERAANLPLERAFATLVAEPLGLSARFAGTTAIAGAVATEVDDRGVVEGLVHDENAYFGGGICGHAGLFARLSDVSTFAAAILDTAAGTPRGRFTPATVNAFLATAAAPSTTWRLGWDTPSVTNSTAGDRWPRARSAGHLGFTGVSLWLDLPKRRWVSLLTNRVHPTRAGESAEAIRSLRRAVNDAAVALLD